jgi:hypothetical protein
MAHAEIIGVFLVVVGRSFVRGSAVYANLTIGSLP